MANHAFSAWVRAESSSHHARTERHGEADIGCRKTVRERRLHAAVAAGQRPLQRFVRLRLKKNISLSLLGRTLPLVSPLPGWNRIARFP